VTEIVSIDVKSQIHFPRVLVFYSRFTALAFAYVERILDTPDRDLALASAMSILHSTLSVLEVTGFQKLVFEDFYEIFVSLIRQIVVPQEHTGTLLTLRTLLGAFQDAESLYFISHNTF
jgi:ubiquitin thioesterase protein OTUB1